MNYDVNPFQVLYVTDSPDPRVFVELFSDLPVRHAAPLFQPGNVVLKGTQGAGKSMLLNLFKPKIRLAYARAEAAFPVREPAGRFLGAGINITLSGALDIGQRPLSDNPEEDEAVFPLYFADFINYFIVRDILRSLATIRDAPDVFGDLVNAAALNQFTQTLTAQDCWFGALDGCDSFSLLCDAIDRRIGAYRSFHQYNSDLPPHVDATKTNIHEPIARTEECLKSAGVISDDTPVFVRIDQIERLHRSDSLRPRLGQQYRRMINKALSKRDSRISYRIGTRRYAWEDDLSVYGTDDQLEDKRDYRIIDLDSMLRRKEDTKTWMFTRFAADAFARRLHHAGITGVGRKDPIGQVFGATPTGEAAAQYCKNASAKKVIDWDDDWPESWTSFLEELFDADPFSAMLAAAWARQRGRSGKPGDRLKTAPPKDKKPWGRTYWKKERVRQCLMQIAHRCQQRLKWSGKDAIVNLSASNISIFLSICHEIWDALLRSGRGKPRGQRDDPLRDGIHPDIQAVGIQAASKDWYVKISEEPKGDDRQRVVEVLGATFRDWLLADSAMSYPGWNGFSLANDDLDAHPAIQRFLQEAVAFGDLYDATHTTKEKDRRQRTKWYLSPVLSEYFQIPEAHIKEPYYASIADIEEWLRIAAVHLDGLGPPASGAIARTTRRKPKRQKDESDGPQQMSLQFED